MNAPVTAIEQPADTDLAWAQREQQRRHLEAVDSAAARLGARIDLDAYLRTQADDHLQAA